MFPLINNNFSHSIPGLYILILHVYNFLFVYLNALSLPYTVAALDFCNRGGHGGAGETDGGASLFSSKVRMVTRDLY